jgi:hypothetical protein
MVSNTRNPLMRRDGLPTVHIPRLQFDDGVHDAGLRTTRLERTVEQPKCLMAERGSSPFVWGARQDADAERLVFIRHAHGGAPGGVGGMGGMDM